MQFQKKSKTTTKVQDQNTIEKAHNCLGKTILQAEEKTIPRDEEKTTSSMVEWGM